MKFQLTLSSKCLHVFYKLTSGCLIFFLAMVIYHVNINVFPMIAEDPTLTAPTELKIGHSLICFSWSLGL